MDTHTLPLEPNPRSVQAARRWVVEVCARLGRPDLAESAELGVSELVTNALLHAEPPLAVRVGGTRQHPRIEVSDGSRTAPTPPGTTVDSGLGVFLDELEGLEGLDGLDDLTGLAGLGGDEAAGGLAALGDPADPDLHGAAMLSTLGRGLGIVSMVSAAWGADVLDEGKVVWFEPVAEDGVGRPVEGAVFTTTADPVSRGTEEGPTVAVLVRGVPVRAYAGFRHHFRELRRELRLLALAHESQYPLAKSLSELLTEFELQLQHGIGADRIDQAVSEGVETLDLPVRMPVSTPSVVTQMLELLELADAFCRAERLLSLARTPHQRRFQRWFLGEFVRQGEGLEPTPWASARQTADRPTS